MITNKDMIQIFCNSNVTTRIILTYPMDFSVLPVITENYEMDYKPIPIIRNRIKKYPDFWLDIHLKRFISSLRKFKHMGEEFLYVSKKEFMPVESPSISILSNTQNRPELLGKLTKIWSNIIYPNQFFQKSVKIKSYLPHTSAYSDELNYMLMQSNRINSFYINIGLKKIIYCFQLELHEKEKQK